MDAAARENGPGPVGSEIEVLPLTLSHVGLRVDGQDLLDGIDLTFDDGRLSVILGPNGAGKTLLLKLCHGLLAPTSGRVEWAHPESLRDPRAQSMVFQRPVILRRSVVANIEYAVRVCGIERRHRRARVDCALALGGLKELAGRPARVLSGGEQQRLALARAWAIRPRVLFLDEPTSHLDPGATRNIEQMITSIRESGTKLIMTTHDLGQAKRLADEIIFMNRGAIVERSDTKRFFQGPETPEARAFIDGRLLW